MAASSCGEKCIGATSSSSASSSAVAMALPLCGDSALCRALRALAQELLWGVHSANVSSRSKADDPSRGFTNWLKQNAARKAPDMRAAGSVGSPVAAPYQPHDDPTRTGADRGQTMGRPPYGTANNTRATSQGSVASCQACLHARQCAARARAAAATAAAAASKQARGVAARRGSRSKRRGRGRSVQEGWSQLELRQQQRADIHEGQHLRHGERAMVSKGR